MNTADNNEREFGGDDAVAAEYVLGVLAADERQAIARRIDTDAAFAQLVDHWEVTLAPMAQGYAPVEPPASVKPALDRKLFSTAASPATGGASIWQSLAFWRGLTVAAFAALALYVAVPFLLGIFVNICLISFGVHVFEIVLCVVIDVNLQSSE